VNRRRAEEDALPAEERARRLGRAGMPALGTRIALSDTGEVLARGNTVLAGYWQQPDATADALEGGWFHTATAARSTTRAT
jgi:long-subunit acyl-CoA synthetase (AMP-forming)